MRQLQAPHRVCRAGLQGTIAACTKATQTIGTKRLEQARSASRLHDCGSSTTCSISCCSGFCWCPSSGGSCTSINFIPLARAGAMRPTITAIAVAAAIAIAMAAPIAVGMAAAVPIPVVWVITTHPTAGAAEAPTPAAVAAAAPVRRHTLLTRQAVPPRHLTCCCLTPNTCRCGCGTS